MHRALSYNPETGDLTWLTGHRRGKIAGYLHKDGYRCLGFKGRKYMAHRVAWFLVHGRWPTNEIDHINRKRADNRLCNLREATRLENAANCSLYRNNSTGYTGVEFERRRGKYIAVVKRNGKRKRVYYGDKLEEAVRAREAAISG